MSETIRQEVVLPASPARVYEAYMDSKEHEALTKHGKAEFSTVAGGTFSCHDGFISGRHIELVPGTRIVQAWRPANWPEGVYSLVRMELTPAGNGTRLQLFHDAIPDGESGHLDAGWHARYWEPMREYFRGQR